VTATLGLYSYLVEDMGLRDAQCLVCINNPLTPTVAIWVQHYSYKVSCARPR